MSKILLVKPTMISKVNPGISHPLGILQLAAVARQHGAREVRILDLRVEEGGVARVVREAKQFTPDVLGVSALTCESPMMHEIARETRAAVPGIKVLAGGPHPTVYPEETLSDGSVDAVVLGEGEATFAELVPLLLSGGDLSTVRGIAYRSNGAVVRTGPRPYIEDLDGLPLPAWDLLNQRGYWKRKTMSTLGPRRYMTMFTSRACPYGCIYCHQVFGKGFRARSADSVLAEMELLGERYGIWDYEIVDDVFNLNRQRVEAICDEIVRKGWKVSLSFPNGLRGDRLDRPLLEKMRRAGTRHMAIAIETASPRLQSTMGKNLDFRKARQAIEDATDLGILTGGFFMLGFPTETEAEMRRTVRFAQESSLHTAQFFIVTPFLGTKMASIYRDKVEAGQGGYESFDYFKGRHNLSEVSDELLTKIQNKANWDFYFGPRRIWRILRSYPRRRYLPLRALRLLQVKVLSRRSSLQYASEGATR